MKTPATAPYVVEEKGALEATEALQRGDERTLAAYIADLATALSRLEAALRPTDKGKAALVFSKIKGQSTTKNQLLHEDAEWDSTLGELEEALRLKSSEVVASYLHDAHSVLRRLSKALAPPAGSKSKKLTFKNASRGRPTDRVQKMRKASDVKRDVMVAKNTYKKTEAAVTKVGTDRGMSRSTTFKYFKSSKPRS